MSYSTRATMLRPQVGTAERAASLEGVTVLLDELGVSHDVIPDLEALFRTDKQAVIKLYPLHINAIMKWASQRHPETRYVVTGKGEDESDAWTHAYEAGVQTITKAPAKSKAMPKTSAKAAAAIEAAGDVRAYSAKLRFAIGNAIEHPSFGKGIVLQEKSDKIVVQFRDCERTLVHGRS